VAVRQGKVSLLLRGIFGPLSSGFETASPSLVNRWLGVRVPSPAPASVQVSAAGHLAEASPQQLRQRHPAAVRPVPSPLHRPPDGLPRSRAPGRSTRPTPAGYQATAASPLPSADQPVLRWQAWLGRCLLDTRLPCWSLCGRGCARVSCSRYGGRCPGLGSRVGKDACVAGRPRAAACSPRTSWCLGEWASHGWNFTT
jgi:hypothetical protein